MLQIRLQNANEMLHRIFELPGVGILHGELVLDIQIIRVGCQALLKGLDLRRSCRLPLDFKLCAQLLKGSEVLVCTVDSASSRRMLSISA